MMAREYRNTVLVVLLLVFFCYLFWAYFWSESNLHLIASATLFLVAGGILLWSLKFEDKLPDTLARYTGGIYYEQDGLCFMPVMRKKDEQAYVCIYFENRFDSVCNAVVHLRPPANSIQHRPDGRDMHFAFTCPGGGVGVIQQPVAVHPRLQGQVIDVEMGAAVNYPQGKGAEMRSHRGLPCGTFKVDWGLSFRTGIHELSTEIELLDAITLHMPIPRGVTNRIRRDQEWRQEMLATA
ncbi:MAG: hypothetical protein ACF8PN_14800 [Phycisphaerales bacterium]